MLDYMTSTIIFFGALVVSQTLARMAHQVLTPEQKLAMIESTPKVPWTLLFVGVAYGAQALLAAQFGHSAALLGGLMVVLVCGLLVSYGLTIRRLQRLNLPSSYIRRFVFSQVLLLVALGFMFWSSYATTRDLETSTEKILNESQRSRTDIR
jgi:hypothetical protein